MRVVRLCTRGFLNLDGVGAKIKGGRWNSPGRPVVYTASCGALAVLEYVVHLETLPSNLVLIAIDVPDTLDIEEVASLPGEPALFKQYGDEWLGAGKTVGLRVPSVLVPNQWNLLLNPEHPLFAAVKVARTSPFVMDPRALTALSDTVGIPI